MPWPEVRYRPAPAGSAGQPPPNAVIIGTTTPAVAGYATIITPLKRKRGIVAGGTVWTFAAVSTGISRPHRGTGGEAVGCLRPHDGKGAATGSLPPINDPLPLATRAMAVRGPHRQ